MIKFLKLSFKSIQNHRKIGLNRRPHDPQLCSEEYFNCTNAKLCILNL